MIRPWPLRDSRVVADLGLFKIRRDRAVSPRTGGERDFVVVGTPDWLQVVPLTAEGMVVLVRQYRHASRRIGLEVPGGLLDPTDPDAASAAARELEEETGYGDGEMIDLGVFWPQPALLENRVRIFAARGVQRRGDQCQDEGEDIEVVLAPAAAVEAMIADGQIHNAMTVMAVLLARRRGLW